MKAIVVQRHDEPRSGFGFFYLGKPDCPGGTWQTENDAEPDRDANLPQ